MHKSHQNLQISPVQYLYTRVKLICCCAPQEAEASLAGRPYLSSTVPTLSMVD